MKFNWLMLLMVILTFIGCKDDEPIYCPDIGGNGHLGINENCIKTEGACSGLKDYRTAVQKSAFPKEIYRYGKASNYTDAQLSNTAQNIIDAYTGMGSDITRNNFIAKVGKVCITKAVNDEYTWDGVVFGIHYVDSIVGDVAALMTSINSLPHDVPVNGLY